MDHVFRWCGFGVPQGVSVNLSCICRFYSINPKSGIYIGHLAWILEWWDELCLEFGQTGKN
jgi:hypothetical protein